MGPEVCVGLWEVLAFNLFLSVNVKQGRAPPQWTNRWLVPMRLRGNVAVLIARARLAASEAAANLPVGV